MDTVFKLVGILTIICLLLAAFDVKMDTVTDRVQDLAEEVEDLIGEVSADTPEIPNDAIKMHQPPPRPETGEGSENRGSLEEYKDHLPEGAGPVKIDVESDIEEKVDTLP